MVYYISFNYKEMIPGNNKMLEDSIEFMNKEYRGQFDHWLIGDSSVPGGKPQGAV